MVSKINTAIAMLAILFGFGFADWQSLNGPPAGRADDMSMGWDPEGNYWVIYAADFGSRLYKSIEGSIVWDSIRQEDIIEPICVVTEPQNAQIVYCGQREKENVIWGVYKSVDGGARWERKVEGITNHYISCIAIDLTNYNILYIGCYRDSVLNPVCYKTTDAGETWVPLMGLPRSLNITKIEVDSQSPNIVWATTENAVWKSTDGGANWSWQLIAESYALSINPLNSDVVYVGNQWRVYKTTDGGDTWFEVFAGGGTWQDMCRALKVDKMDTTIVYAGFDNRGVYKTTDCGANWRPMLTGLVCRDILAIQIHPDNHQIIYTAAMDNLYKSTDGGESWFEFNKGMRLPRIMHLAVDLPNNYYTGTSNGTFIRSNDGGANWKATHSLWSKIQRENPPPFIVPRFNGIAVSALQENTVFIAEGSESPGILRSSDWGNKWDWVYKLSMGLCIEVDPTDPSYVYAGQPPSAPGRYSFLRSSNGGNSWTQISISVDGVWPVPSRIKVKESASNVIYLSDEGNPWLGTYLGVLRSDDRGDHWIQLKEGLPAIETSRCFALTPIDNPDPSNDILYIGFDYNGIYKSTNGGGYWSPINNGLQINPSIMRDIVIDPEEPSLVYAASSVEPKKVYLTVDAGRKWINIGSSLPNLRVFKLTMDIQQTDRLFAGTERGIYYYTIPFNKHLVSSSPVATSFNNSRKIVRARNTFWSVYESSGVIYATKSTDFGTTWGKKIELGQGIHPAINIPAVIMPYGPELGVAWVTNTETFDTLYYAELKPEGWVKSVVYVSEFYKLETPSLAYTDNETPHIVVREYATYYPYTTLVKHIWRQGGINYSETVPNSERGLYPSCGFETSSQTFNVVWEENNAIHYAYKDLATQAWTYQGSISTGNLVDCHHPSMDVAGKNVYVVFEAKRLIVPPETEHDIYYVTIAPARGIPTAPRRIFDTGYESQFAEMVGGRFVVWQENLGGNNFEVYFSRYNPATNQWSIPQNVSGTLASSCYPHLVWRRAGPQDEVYAIWTERDAPPYDIKFKRIRIPLPSDYSVSTSDLSEATGYNNSSRLIRDANNTLHLCFTNDDAIYHTYLTDTTWSEPVYVGAGKYPALAFGNERLCALYAYNSNSPPFLEELRFAQRESDAWMPNPIPLMHTYNSFLWGVGAPSFAIKDTIGYFVFESTFGPTYHPGPDGPILMVITLTGTALIYGRFSLNHPEKSQWQILDKLAFGPSPISVDTIVYRDSLLPRLISPSIAVDGDGLVHILWEGRGDSLRYYRIKDTLITKELLSGPGIDFPYITTRGDQIDHFWCQEGIIKHRYGWTGTTKLSQTQTVATCESPISSGQYLTWTKREDGLSYLYYGAIPASGAIKPIEVNRSADLIACPQIHFNPKPPSLDLVWTEYSEWDSIGYICYLNLPLTEVAPTYAFDMGQETQVPICVRRAGCKVLGPEDYKTFDYDSTELIYRLSLHSPGVKYKIRWVWYHEEAKKIKLQLNVDGILHRNRWVKPGKLVTEEAWIPDACIQDNEITIKVKVLNGTIAVLSGLEIHAEIVGGGGGPQARDAGPYTLNSLRLLPMHPNPAKGVLKIRFNSPDDSKVTIKLYDVVGRLAQTVFDSNAKIGMNEVLLRPKDLSSGVYFIQLESGDYKKVEKVILLK